MSPRILTTKEVAGVQRSLKQMKYRINQKTQDKISEIGLGSAYINPAEGSHPRPAAGL